MSTQIQDRKPSGRFASIVRRQSTRCYKKVERTLSRRRTAHESAFTQTKSPTFEVYRVELPDWIGRSKANPIGVSQRDDDDDGTDAGSTAQGLGITGAAVSPSMPSSITVQDSNRPRSPSTDAYPWPDHPLLAATQQYRESLHAHYKPYFDQELAWVVMGEAWPDYAACPQRWENDPHKFLLAHNMVYAHHFELDRVLQRQEDLIAIWAPHRLPFGGGGPVTQDLARHAHEMNRELSWDQIMFESVGQDDLRTTAELCKLKLARLRQGATMAFYIFAPYCICTQCEAIKESRDRRMQGMRNMKE